MAMWDLIKPLKPRGVRFSLPQGFFLGRVSPGYGDAELIPIRQLADQLSKTGLIADGPVNSPPELGVLGVDLTGPFAIGDIYRCASTLYDVTYPDPNTTSTAKCTTAPLGNISAYLVTDLAAFQASPPTGAIARCDFTSGSTTGTVTWLSTEVTVPAGTLPYLCFPTTDFDSTLAGITLLFAGKI